MTPLELRDGWLVPAAIPTGDNAGLSFWIAEAVEHIELALPFVRKRDVAVQAGANLGIRLIQVHFCFIYLAAGLSKLKGDAWWNGFAFWDVMFGTWLPSEPKPVTIGLQDGESLEYRSLWAMYTLPFRKCWRQLRRRATAVPTSIVPEERVRSA